jgi:hypothetical protein
MITMVYVSKDELNALHTDKQTNHCTSCLFRCLYVSNRQQSSTLLYMPRVALRLVIVDSREARKGNPQINTMVRSYFIIFPTKKHALSRTLF